MSIGNAIKFIRNVEADDDFRKSLYKVKGGWDALDVFLKERDLHYTPGEFEEAFNHLHTECQFEEQADRLFNVVNLLKLVLNDDRKE